MATNLQWDPLNNNNNEETKEEECQDKVASPRNCASCCRINKEMIPCKLFFFFFEASFGALVPFINLFYVSSGLTAATMGLSNGVGNCCALIAGPLWGALIDSTRYKKTIASFLFLTSTAIEVSKPWIIVSVANATVAPANSTVNISRKRDLMEAVVNNPGTVFYTVMFLGALASIVFAGLVTFIEGLIVNIVFSREKVSYGEQKVRGSKSSADWKLDKKHTSIEYLFSCLSSNLLTGTVPLLYFLHLYFYTYTYQPG